jgi:DNA-binding transcriptional ArsR family regulator
MRALMVVRNPEQAAALLHPIRQSILIALRTPNSAAALARSLKIPRQLITYHLNCLEHSALVTYVEERQVRQMKEKVYEAAAERFLIDPVVLGDLAPPKSLTDPTSPTQLAGLLQATSVEALTTDAPTLALCYDIGFGDRDERLETFQTIMNSTNKIAKSHDIKGTDEHYRLVVGVIRPVDEEDSKNT